MTLLLIIIGFFISNQAFAPNLTQIPLGLYNEIKTPSIDIDRISFIESNNNSSAVSSENAVGIMQITKITLKEWNNLHPNERYSLKDLKNEKVNVKIGTWYLTERIPFLLNSYNIPLTEVNILMSYNWGIGNLKMWYNRNKKLSLIPIETQHYIIKYYQGKQFKWQTFIKKSQFQKQSN